MTEPSPPDEWDESVPEDDPTPREDPTPRDDSTPRDDPTTGRRALLAAVATGAAGALAGCEEDLTRTPPPGPDPEVTLSDVRLVQTCEDGSLTNASGGVSDPPLAAGDETTVLFDLSVTYPDKLPEETPVAIGSDSGTSLAAVFQLSRADAKAIDAGADPRAVFHETAHGSGPGEAPPVFELPAGVSRISVEVGPLNPYVLGNEVDLVEGSNADFEVRTVPTLRVGFVPVKDRGSVSNETDVDWGNANGEVTNYRRSVRSSMAFLRQVFPGDVVAYRHDNPILGRIKENVNDATGKDASAARTTLNTVKDRSTFPNGGAILPGDVDRQQAVSTMAGDQGGAFDVRVMVLPRGTGSGNQDYFSAHGMSGTVGYFWSQKQAVGSLEALARGDDVTHVNITAQEIAHRYAFGLYTGAVAASSTDQRHADGNLASVGYALADGEYDLVNDWSVSDGTFTPGSTRFSGGDPDARPVSTYMKPSVGGDVWADGQVTRYLLEGQYTPGYSGGSSPAVAPVEPAAAPVQPTEIQPVLEMYGTVADERVRFVGSAVYDGQPEDADGGNFELEAAPDARPVAVALSGPDGEQLVEAIVPDRVGGTHHDRVHETVAVAVPFPERGVELVAERDGARTVVNPAVRPLRDAVERVPERGFATGEEARARLTELLSAVDALMTDRQYAEAAAVLSEEFGAAVDETVVDYEGFANQPTRADLLRVGERMRGRLEGLAGNG